MIVSRILQRGLAVLLLLSFASLLRGQEEQAIPVTPVGISGEIADLVIDGPKLEVIPLKDKTQPVVLRIAEIFPHGSGFRYQLVYYGLEPGTFDLTEYLKREDGGKVEDVDSIEVKIVPSLEGKEIQLSEISSTGQTRLSRYHFWKRIAIAAWVIGLLAILFFRRREQKGEIVGAQETRESFADQLKPLIEQAMAGEMDESDHGKLERMLLSYWRDRLDLQEVDPVTALAQLRKHDEAGPLILQLERWLHQRNPDQDVNLMELLGPYRD